MLHNIIILLLFMAGLFFLIYSVIVGEYPEIKTFKDKLKHIGVPLICAAAFLTIGKIIFMSMLSGLIWAVVGWYMPLHIMRAREKAKRKKYGKMTRDFIATAASIYGSGQTTSEVIGIAAKNFAEPFASEFQAISGQVGLNRNVNYHSMIEKMGEKYKVKELSAVAPIIKATEYAGGPLAAAASLRELSIALKDRDKQLAEREKENIEPNFACYIGMGLLSIGLLLDVTVFRSLYNDAPVMLALGNLIFIAIYFARDKINTNKDLELC